MVTVLDKTAFEYPLKTISLELALFSSKQLEVLVTENTRSSITGISSSFQQDVDTWPKYENYKLAKATASSIKNMNDASLCGVALMDEYNMLQTKNKDQKQFLL